METIVLNFTHTEGFSDEEFYYFCLDNPQLKFERTADGQIIIMANTGGKTGRVNAKINYFLTGWSLQSQLGETFDSLTTFHLPSGADRSPDAAWIENSRWQTLAEKQKAQFPPLCPNFVIELLSESDVLATLQKKMDEEWLHNGCKLAWLIDPKHEITYIYRVGEEMETVSGFKNILSGMPVLPGFTLDLASLKD